MGFTELVLLLLFCMGVMLTFVHMTIMDIIGLRPLWEKVDFFKKLFSCSACTGWHVGAWSGIPLIILLYLGYLWIFYMITIPFASLSFCYLMERLSILIDFNAVLTEKKLDNVVKDDTLKNEITSFDDSDVI